MIEPQLISAEGVVRFVKLTLGNALHSKHKLKRGERGEGREEKREIKKFEEARSKNKTKKKGTKSKAQDEGQISTTTGT